MKRTIFLTLAFVTVLCAAATDRFYIENFDFGVGKTAVVSIQLDNENTYTAFQTDIYLPEGLTIEQEDGEYIFDLTSRKGRDHNIASQVQVDGSIRVMSYSPSIKAYSGNNGALVTFNVIADADFTGTTSIMLKNTLFTTTAGIEIPFADEECTVTVLQMGDVNGDGFVNVSDVTALISHILGNEVTPFYKGVAELTDDGLINVADVTTLIAIILSN